MKKTNLKEISSIVSINPQVRNGKPCFKETRTPVDYVINHFSLGWNIDEIAELFPDVKRESITSVLQYLSTQINDVKISRTISTR